MVHLQNGGLVFGFRFGKSGAVVPRFHVGQHLTARDPFAFVDINYSNHAFDLRLHLRAMRGRHHRIAVNPQRQRENTQKNKRRGGQRDNHAAALFFHGHEFSFSLQHRLKHRDEGHFLIHLRVAQSHGGLAGKNCQNLDVGLRKKIGISAFQTKDTHAAGVVAKGHGVKGPAPGLVKISFKLRAGLFALGIHFFADLTHVNHFFGESRPLQNFIQWSDVRRIRVHLRDATHGAEFESSAPLQGNGGTIIRNHRLRRVDDGLQHAFQIQRGSNLVTDGHQCFQNFYFAFGQQQPGVVQRRRSCFRHAGQYEQVIFVKQSAIHFVDRFDDSNQRAFIQNGHHHQRSYAAILHIAIARLQPFVFRGGDERTFTGVGNGAGDAFTGGQRTSLPNGGIGAGLVRKLHSFVGLQQPDVYRLALHHFAQFRADEHQQLIHLQRGRENFLNVVEL